MSDSRPAIQDLLRLFDPSQGPGRTVAICSHINPDGDAIGSVLALAGFLEARGFTVTKLLANEQRLPRAYGFLGVDGFLPAASYTAVPDIFVAVDLSQASRLHQAQAVLSRAKYKVLIDHHPAPEGFADISLHDSAAAAAGLLVWELVTASGDAIDPGVATACYVAVLTDTGRFTFQNTSAEVLRAAAQMIEAGADPVATSRAVYDSRSLGLLQLDALLIERLEPLLDGRMVVSWVTIGDYKKLRVAADEAQDLVNLLRSLAGVELAVLLRWDDYQTRVNLRAPGTYDVSALARDFGGGGHAAAAGFNFAGTIDQAKLAIMHYIESEGVLYSDSGEPG